MAIEVRQISTLPSDIDVLNTAATSEGFGMVQTLISNFGSAANCFDKPGEALYAACRHGQIAGIGGINIDPYYCQPKIGRIRHLYIHPEHRRVGLGRALLTEIETKAVCHFERFQLFTSNIEAARFYESLGYLLVVGKWKVSHVETTL